MVDKEDFIRIWICIMFRRRKSHGYVSCMIIRETGRDRERQEERMRDNERAKKNQRRKQSRK